MIRFNDPSSAGFGVSPAAALPQAPVAQLHSRLKAKGARMPKNLDEEARECRRHAKGCTPEADAQTAFFELQRLAISGAQL
jgi:hypothetical protein